MKMDKENQEFLENLVKPIHMNNSKAVKVGDGWVYSREFYHFQKVHQGVYVYVTPRIGHWIAQMYLRGEIGMCNLEARTYEGNIKALFELAEQWLLLYGEDASHYRENPYCPSIEWREDAFDKWLKESESEESK